MTRVADVAGLADVPGDAADSLRSGGLVIYPTDTLYGMGVDPRSPAALDRLFRVKGREAGKPIPLLLAGPGQVECWAGCVPEAASALMARFWPGALTLVLPAAAGVLPAITGGGETVGLRVPAHPVARTLAASAGGAVTGTSANRAGEAGGWQSADALLAEFAAEADWLLWDGPAGSALPSTVVSVSASGTVSLVREGTIPLRVINEYLKGRR